jgi:hypothetical protein
MLKNADLDDLMKRDEDTEMRGKQVNRDVIISRYTNPAEAKKALV